MDEFRLADSSKPFMTITSMSYKKRSTSGALLSTQQRTRGASTRMHASLPLPTNLQISTSFDWSEESLSLVSKGGSHVYENGFDLETAKKTIAGLGHRISDAALEKFGSRIVAQNQGRAADPMKEIFFNGVNYRRHDWSWQFQPKNSTEAKAAYDFCEMLKTASSASRSEVSTYFDIPDSFHIEFDSRLHLPAIPECVCTEVTADYTAGGAAIFHSDGYPAYIGLSAAFLETVLPLKD